jgi:hypothetical protein
MKKPDLHRAEMSPAERELRARATQLLQGAGLLHGNLIERETVCGRPTCRCTKGERHQVLHLYRRLKGRRLQLYVPRYLEETVRRWIAQDQELREVLAQLWELEWEKLRSMKTRKQE